MNPIDGGAGMPDMPVFSAVELSLELNRRFMAEAENRNLKLDIRVSGGVPVFLRGPFSLIRGVVQKVLLLALENGARGTVSVVFDYGNALLFTLNYTPKTLGWVEMGMFSTALDFFEDRYELCFRQNGFNEEVQVEFFDVFPEMGQSQDDGEKMVLSWLTADMEVSDLAEEVLRSIPERMDRIREASALGSATVLKELVHGFKGIAGNFHMSELYTALVTLEKAIKEDRDWSADLCQLERLVGMIPNRFTAPATQMPD